MRRTYNLILIVSVFFLLTGCGSDLEFTDCVKGNCTYDETYEVTDGFIDGVFEDANKEFLIDEFDLQLELDVFDDYYDLQLDYRNSNDNYLEGYDVIPKLYDIFITIETKLIQLNITKQFELKVKGSYNNGTNYFQFVTSEVDNYRNLIIVSNEDFNSLGDYIEDNIIHFDKVLAYGEDEFTINMIFAATAHPIRFEMDKGFSNVVVTISDEINNKEGYITVIEECLSEHVDSKYTFSGEIEN